MVKALKLSIVIPVYNEENHIKACLDAVLKQTVMPDEVVVVDNNCTDKTVEIAQSYPFVRVVEEPKQGRSPARSKGFDEAKGDIIGRIDADSRILPNWCERVRKTFEDGTIAGVGGLGLTYTLPLRPIPNFYSTFWSRVYYWSTHADTRVMTMWGANMALLKSAWLDVRDKVNSDDSIVHEDIDLSLELIEAGHKIAQDDKMLIKTRGQDYHFFPKTVEYAIRRIKTQFMHRRRGYIRDPKVHKVSFLRAEWWRLITFIPGILFLITSLLCWPIDAIMIKKKGMGWLR